MSEETKKPHITGGEAFAPHASSYSPTELFEQLAEAVAERELIEHIIDAQHDTFFVRDTTTGKALRWNRAFKEISGYTDEEIADLPAPQSYYSREDLDRVEAFVQDALRGEVEAIELDLIRKDGRQVPMEYRMSAILDDHGQPKYILSIGRDITERKKAEQALRTSEQKFRGYINDIAAGVVAHAPDTSILYCNQRALDILGLSLDEMLGKTAIDEHWKFLNEDGSDMAYEDFPIKRALASTEHLQNYVVGIVHPERDSVTWVVCTSHTVRDPDGAINHVLITFFDITELRRAEERGKELQERLTRAERMESVGVLAGGIAHDLNNLLCPNVLLPEIILSDLQDVTREQCPAIDIIRENIEAIEQCSQNAAEMIKDISSLSRSAGQHTVPMDINYSITQYLKSLEFEELQTSLPEVRFDFQRNDYELCMLGSLSDIARLLSNLIRNAALAIEKAGTVTIKTSAVHLTEPLLGYDVIEPGAYVVLEISDTGSGIAPDTLKRVFEPFFTTRKQASHAGSGLGLSVVHGIVINHGGSIDVTTQLGSGTTFSLYFPATEAQPDQVAMTDEDGPGGTERILVVDDDPHQILVACRALKIHDYTVSTAGNGHEALALFAQAKARGEESPFDLVLLDMLMEEGFDGLTTYREILKLYPEQKATIVSGYAGDQEAGEKARKLGVNWLAKPYHKEEMARAVRAQLDQRT